MQEGREETEDRKQWRRRKKGGLEEKEGIEKSSIVLHPENSFQDLSNGNNGSEQGEDGADA